MHHFYILSLERETNYFQLQTSFGSGRSSRSRIIISRRDPTEFLNDCNDDDVHFFFFTIMLFSLSSRIFLAHKIPDPLNNATLNVSFYIILPFSSLFHYRGRKSRLHFDNSLKWKASKVSVNVSTIEVLRFSLHSIHLLQFNCILRAMIILNLLNIKVAWNWLQNSTLPWQAICQHL